MFNALTIGAGSIGGLKPDKFDSLGGENILTHMHAYHSHDKINLVGVVDTDITKADKAAVKWNTEPYINIHEAFKYHKIDIVSVCVPTQHHHSVMMELLQYDFRLLIAEKPFCLDYTEAEAVECFYKEKDIPIVVNYGRRFCDVIKNSVEGIKDEKIQSIVFYYNHGLLRDGVHCVDMINWLCNVFFSGLIIGEPIYDLSEKDPTYGIFLEYSGCKNINLVPMDRRNYDVFEMVIHTKKAKWIFGDHFKTIARLPKQKEPTYGNYDSMPSINNGNIKYINTNLLDSLPNLVNIVCLFLNGKISYKDIPCTSSNAIDVHRVIIKLKR